MGCLEVIKRLLVVKRLLDVRFVNVFFSVKIIGCLEAYLPLTRLPHVIHSAPLGRRYDVIVCSSVVIVDDKQEGLVRKKVKQRVQ